STGGAAARRRAIWRILYVGHQGQVPVPQSGAREASEIQYLSRGRQRLRGSCTKVVASMTGKHLHRVTKEIVMKIIVSAVVALSVLTAIAAPACALDA